ncbi:MAG: DUF59 domain-containing protein [Propionibacteriales bacterium]|nr:DUF59 domain-containing protein [Propionibacteriales bacterium]
MTDDGLRAAAWHALSTVSDPELDEPITDLGFVAELTVDDDRAACVLRLPTYFCAPNFAYLMVADAYDALAAVPGVERVQVRLDDHFASEEINAGVAAEFGFADTFAGLADGELADLRQAFRRKAHLAAVDRVCGGLRADGWSVEELARLRLRDVPQSEDRERLCRRRRDLGLPAGPDDHLLVEDDGRPLAADELPAHLRFAQVVRVSIDGNAGFCRGLLRTRYGDDETLRSELKGGTTR